MPLVQPFGLLLVAGIVPLDEDDEGELQLGGEDEEEAGEDVAGEGGQALRGRRGGLQEKKWKLLSASGQSSRTITEVKHLDLNQLSNG